MKNKSINFFMDFLFKKLYNYSDFFWWVGVYKMYYASIDILALLTLLITNNDILFKRTPKLWLYKCDSWDILLGEKT